MSLSEQGQFNVDHQYPTAEQLKGTRPALEALLRKRQNSSQEQTS